MGLAAIRFPSGFSEDAARDYKALLQANLSEKRPSKRYPKWKFHRTQPGCVVNTPDEEQSLGGGWRDRPFTAEELAAPEEPAAEAPQPALDEVKEILHKSRGQLLQELHDFLFPRVCPIVDSPEDAIRWIRTILVRSCVWIDNQPEAKIYEAISAKTYRYADDGLTVIIDAAIRPELVDVVNVDKYEAALEEVARRTAPPPSDADRLIAEIRALSSLLLPKPPKPLPPKEPESPQQPPAEQILVNPRTGRRIWRTKIEQFQKREEIKSNEALAKRLAVSIHILGSIKRGDDRHGDATERDVLRKIGIIRD